MTKLPVFLITAILSLLPWLASVRAEEKPQAYFKAVMKAGLKPLNEQAKAIDGPGTLVAKGRNKPTPTIVLFWASWCEYCQTIEEKLDELRKRYPTTELGIAGISVERKEERARTHLQGTPVSFPMWYSGELVRRPEEFEILPFVMVLNKDGRPVGTYSGFSPERMALVESRARREMALSED